MRFFDQKKLDLAFVQPGAPMFADLICKLEANGRLSATRRRDLISGLRRVAKALGRPPQEIPADPKWLQPRIARILPASLGLTQKSWTNAMSDAKSAMAQCGIVKRHKNRIEDLTSEWRALWRMVLANKDPTLPPALQRFVYFLSRHGVAPHAVSEEHAIAYRDALAANEISKDPETAYRAAVNGWNLARCRLPKWPQQELTLPNRAGHIVLPLESFPLPFQRALETYCDQLAAPDPLSADQNAVALSSSTVGLYRNRVHRLTQQSPAQNLAACGFPSWRACAGRSASGSSAICTGARRRPSWAMPVKPGRWA